jgi:hypothetical protein
MSHKPKYVLIWRGGYYAIGNVDANLCVGWVDYDVKNKVFRVKSELGPLGYNDCSSLVGVVGALSEAITALANFYEKNPPQWKIENLALWWKETQYGRLRVEPHTEGHWRAYRDSYPMLRGAKPAEFRTDDEARSAADAHLLDFYPGHEPLNDGLSWLADPEIGRPDRYSVKNWAVLERLANEDKKAMTMQRLEMTLHQKGLLRAAEAALDKNASPLQRRAISTRVDRTYGLVKNRILDARAMRLLGIH